MIYSQRYFKISSHQLILLINPTISTSFDLLYNKLLGISFSISKILCFNLQAVLGNLYY